MDDDCYLPGKKRPIPELTAKAKLSVSNGEGELLRNGIDRDIEDDCNAWRGKAGDFAEYSFDKEEKISGIRIVFDSFRLRPDVLNIVGLYFRDRKDFQLPETLIRAFHIEVDGKEVFRTTENSQRLFRLPLDCHGKTVKLILDDDVERGVFAFDVF